MKALIYTAPETLQYSDAPPPRAEAAAAHLIRVEAAGICGSDMHAFLGHDERRPPPLILGHEAAGTVVADGRRVTINPLITCGECADCRGNRHNLCRQRQIISMPPRQGAFAEFVNLPADNLMTVPDDIPFEKAALAEPLACGWHAVRLGGEALRQPLAESRCLVIGGGAIGLGAALALHAAGNRSIGIVETNALRRKTAALAGDFEIYPSPAKLPSAAADLVIDAVGMAATRQIACQAVRPGGVIIHIGLGEAAGGIDVRRLTLQEIIFIGTYTYTPADFHQTAAAIFSGRLGRLDWIETRPLADGAQAFDDLRRGTVAAAKIILTP